MHISEELFEALVEQFRREKEAALFYRQAANYYHDEDLDGFAHFMTVQRDEELEHAERIYDFLVESDAVRFDIPTLNGPDVSFDTIAGPVKKALKHEQEMTEHIRGLSATMEEQQDYAARSLLNWFEEEQLEEENLFERLLKQVRLAESDDGALLVLDNELGERPAE